MSKKKKKKSNEKEVVKIEEKVDKEIIEDKKSDTVVNEDKSFEKLFEKEMQEKKVKDKEKLERYKEEKEAAIERKKKVVKHPVVHTFLVMVLITSLFYFIISLFYNDDTDSITILINSLLLMIFTILFVSVSITTNRKNKTGFFASAVILLAYFIFGILMTIGVISFPNNRVINFSGMKLTEVVKWSEKNKIEIIQDYEYSDMIDEYHVISQNVEPGTKIKDVDSITVSISEGPSPSKEIVVPNMVSWDSERVLDFIKKNHLSNVDIEFVKSTKQVNTVIEQSKSGNMRRDEALKLTFSYGEELEFSEVKLKDLTNMSRFEATFYLKQNHLNYKFEEVFSSKVKKGYVVKQSVKSGEMVKLDGDAIIIYISKGPEIKVPNLTSMTMTEITEWVISNKLKLEFSDKYDDTVKENAVISSNYKEGDIVAEGTVIEVVISRGKLIMPEFGSYDEFRDWAEKYSINYDEQHEFSSSVEAGKVISYSYKSGATIKNNDSIVVVISDGKEATVPNVVGSTKANAASKLENAGFKVNYVYKCSNSVNQSNVIRQSISSGSKVAQGTTITLTISSGKCATSSSGNTGGGSTPTTPTCDTSKGAVFWDGAGGTGTDTFKILKNQNPGFTIIPTYVDSCPNGSTASGELCSINITPETWVSYCTTVRVTIIK